MRIRYVPAAAALLLALASGQTALAQQFAGQNPNVGNPFSRPALSPYLNMVGGPVANYFFGTQREFDIRAQLLRPIYVTPDLLSGYDSTRSPYSGITGYQSADEFVNQRLRETQLPPSGHPTGFLMASPFYRLPNQRSFAPYSQAGGQQPGR